MKLQDSNILILIYINIIALIYLNDKNLLSVSIDIESVNLRTIR